MNGRGRPRTPDILTPREYEVLQLLRLGLTNREIGERLGISLAGAKYHVSEIITKLGVANREEAAAWEREPVASRRWGFAPLTTLQAWYSKLVAPAAMKVGIAGTLVIAATGIGVTLTDSDSESRAERTSTAVMTLTPGPNPCEGYPPGECIGFFEQKIPVASLLEAADHTSFVPVLPTFIPPGYERVSLTYIWPGEIPPHMKDNFDEKGPRAPTEALYAQYVNQQGSRLLINQGYGHYPGLAIYETAPAYSRGEVSMPPRTVYWYAGNQVWEEFTDRYGHAGQRPRTGAWKDSSRTVVFWELYGPSAGKGWEISPGGTRREFDLQGQPFVYIILSDSLPLEEMLKIAASVP